MSAIDDGQPNADEAGSPTDGRRSFLKKTAVAGAAVWVAPTIISQQAAFAATCANRTLDWQSAFSVGPDPSSVPVPSGSAVVLGPTTTTFSFSDPTSAVLSSTADYVFPRGGAPTYHMQLNGTGAGPVDILLTFSTPVSNLSFSVLDVDQDANSAGWRDRIVVQGLNGATPQTAATASGGATTTDTSVPPTYTFTGNANAPNPGTTGDVAFAWAVPITSVTIQYSRAGALLTQGIGLSNITFCS